MICVECEDGAMQVGSVKTITVGVYGQAEQQCAKRENLDCGNAGLLDAQNPGNRRTDCQVAI